MDTIPGWRKRSNKAKQHATAQLKSQCEALGFEELNLKTGEGLWARNSHPKPIADAAHFVRAFDYIRKHEKRGATVVIPDEPERGASDEWTEDEALRDFDCLD